MDSSRVPTEAPASRGRAAPAGRPPRGIRHEPRRFITSARFLLRSLNLRGAAFLLALLAVTVGATVTATVLNLKAGLKEKMSRELRAYGPNLLVVPRSDTAAQRAGDPASITLLEEDLRAVPAILGSRTAVVPVLIAGGTAAGHAATLVGADFDALHRLYPGWRLEPAPPAGPACVLGVALARRAGARAGDPIEIGTGSGSATLRVASLLSTGEAEDEQVFVPLAFLQGLVDRPGQASFAALSIDGGAPGVGRASAAIDRALPRARARPLRAIALAEGALLDRLDRMMHLLTLVILLLSGLCLVTTLMSMVVERESEIGLARAIGAGDGEIFRMFLGEIGLLGVLGTLAGLVLGAGVTRLIGEGLFGAPIEASLSVAPVVLGMSMLICLIAVYVPLRRALAIQPAAALRGE
ncbi:MAG TPA: FtsX-like permease family protein [Candidatus Polarisedimenticolia bacterium]|nr:FtsX-like permease family protein [Candidatus Polarisedimenticolia bacterium]